MKKIMNDLDALYDSDIAGEEDKLKSLSLYAMAKMLYSDVESREKQKQEFNEIEPKDPIDSVISALEEQALATFVELYKVNVQSILATYRDGKYTTEEAHKRIIDNKNNIIKYMKELKHDTNVPPLQDTD